MSIIVKPGTSVVKTEYDKCDVVLTHVQCVQFDLRDVLELVDEMAVKGIAGNALLVPPLRLRQLCEVSGSGSSPAALASSSGGGGGASGNPAASRWKTSSPSTQLFRSIAAETGVYKKDDQQQHQQNLLTLSNNNKPGASSAASPTGGKAVRPSSFAQAVWDRAVHMYRLMRHLGRPIHTAPVAEYQPGELLTKMDAYSTELELLLLRSRSGKGGDDELCYQFVRGGCPRGASCSFAHSKMAVQRWAQQWAGQQMRDYSNFRILQKQGRRASSTFSTGSPTGMMPAAAAEAGGASQRPAQQQQQQPVSLRYKTEHPLSSGTMLRFDESIGPEALAIVLDLIHTRDQFSPEINQPAGREARLHSIVIRHALTRPTFDVLCSTLEMCLFRQLAALDLGKCDLANAVGRHRVGKLGKVLRRFFNEKGKLLQELRGGGGGVTSNNASFAAAAGSSVGRGAVPAAAIAAAAATAATLEGNSAQQQQQQDRDHGSYISPSNRMMVSLGNNNITNGMVSGFLTSFLASGPEANRAAVASVTAALTGAGQTPVGAQQGGGGGASPAVGAAALPTSPRGGPQHTSAASFTTSAATALQNDLSLLSGSFAGAGGAAGVSNALSPSNNMLNNSSSALNASSSEVVIGHNTTLSQTTHNAMPTSTGHPLLALNLELNLLGPSVPDFSDFVHSIELALPFIEKLSLAGNPLTHDGTTRLFHGWRHSCVRYLDLSGCALGDRGTIAVCDAVRALTNFPLRLLNLGWNGVATDGVAALGDLLRSRSCALQSLGLAYNPAIGRRGAIVLSQALKENDTIRKLDMRWCHVQDEGCLALLDALGQSRNTSLAMLRFDKHDVDQRTIEMLDEKLGPVAEACQEEMELLQVESVW